jgi:ligand-binding sensor domain-containing protein
MSIKQKKYSNWKLKSHSILILVFLVLSCKGQHQLKNTEVIRSKNGFNSVCLDSQGILWFGSNGGGVYSFNENSFTHFSKEEGLSDDMVRTIFVDKAGTVWFGFNGNRNSGLTSFNGKIFQTFTKEDGLCNTNIMAIYEDKKGQL